MMTEQERKEQFIALVKQAESLFGVKSESSMNLRQYGGMIQVEPGPVQYTLIENWQPSEPEDKPAP